MVQKGDDGGDGEPPSKKSKEEPSTSSLLQPENMVESVIRSEDRSWEENHLRGRPLLKGGNIQQRCLGYRT